MRTSWVWFQRPVGPHEFLWLMISRDLSLQECQARLRGRFSPATVRSAYYYEFARYRRALRIRFNTENHHD